MDLLSRLVPSKSPFNPSEGQRDAGQYLKGVGVAFCALKQMVRHNEAWKWRKVRQFVSHNVAFVKSKVLEYILLQKR